MSMEMMPLTETNHAHARWDKSGRWDLASPRHTRSSEQVRQAARVQEPGDLSPHVAQFETSTGAPQAVVCFQQDADESGSATLDVGQA
jgi:hypothetical protein